MPDYRWGIFLTEPDKEAKIGFGDHQGEDVWNEVPGEYRNNLRRLIVTQGDTEPASVEQQRMLGHTAPSLYDMRNLFQVNVEEGRHLWAMVYLLHSYFGKDGREEAEELLERRSGHADHPRILTTFNEPIDDWLSFFCFTTFTDRDGKYQLLSLAESGFDPLARTCRFMLTEEAHHMFVGQTGINRVIQRTCEVMAEHPNQDVREYGAIPLDIVQKYVRRWSSSSLDLFGAEVSSNAATFFGQSIKGRAYEKTNYDDHTGLDAGFDIESWDGNKIEKEQVPLRNAMNEVLREDYYGDNERQVGVWNKTLERQGLDTRIELPHRRFNRQIGMYSGLALRSGGSADDRRGLAGAKGRLAADRRGRGLRQVIDGEVPRAGQDRRLDRAADEGDRQSSLRVRVRPELNSMCGGSSVSLRDPRPRSSPPRLPRSDRPRCRVR